MMKRQLLILLAILALFGQNTMGQPNSNKNTVALGVPILDDNGDFTGTYTIDTYTDVPIGDEYTLPGCDVIVSGYDFVGWSTEGDGTHLEPGETAHLYQPNDTYTPEATIVFLARYKMLELSLSDDGPNGDVLETYNGRKTTSVTLSGRTLFKDNTWNTLCLPFSIDNLSGTPLEGAQVKELASSSFSAQTGTLTLNFSENLTEIEAGHPYVVKWESGSNIESPKFEGVTISSTEPVVKETDAASFVGTFSPYTIGRITYPVAVLDGNTLTFTLSDTPADGITSWSTEDTGNSPGWLSDEIKLLEVRFDPSFAKARPKSCRRWFNNQPNLKRIIDLKYLNTSEVTDMSFMFTTLYDLGSVDVSHFNTEKVESMVCMFASCPFMTLDLSSFNTAKVKEMDRMFMTNPYLKTIYVSDKWTTEKVTDNGSDMFYRCESLKGSEGTVFDENHLDMAYAHIDGGETNPGYLTYKAAPEQSTETQSDDEDSDPSILYMGADNTLYYPNAAMAINSFRAYFRLADGLVASDPEGDAQNVKVFLLNFDDESTGISLNTDASNNGEGSGYYTINGQRLNGMPTRKGVYIINGKKVVIK